MFDGRPLSLCLLRWQDDIMTAIMPDEEQNDLPTGFTIVGHVGAS